MNRNTKHVSTPFGIIAYTEHGAGPAALFVHGVFLNGYYWRHVIDRVADMRRCIAVDLLAHGGTGASDVQDLSFSAQADMLDAFCTALALEPVDLVANDSGGGIAQIFAARHPERIRSLTLTNCDTHDNWPLPAFQPVVRAAARGLYADLGPKMLADVALARTKFAPAYEHPERISAETFRTYLEPVFGTPAAIRNLERFITSLDCRHTVAVEPLLRRLQAPTLVVWGTDDVYFPVKWAYWLRDTIPGCRKVIELAGARLFFPEERPEELAQVLREHWQVKQPSATASVTAVRRSLKPPRKNTAG
jgi:pimeloyl-ACP methyl ester carboxylesterase